MKICTADNPKTALADLAVRSELRQCGPLVSVRRTLRILSLLVALAALVAWFALGANRGWTRTSVAMKTTDEVTGIEGVEYQKRFVPGLELLAVAALGAMLLAGSSLLFRNQQSNKQSTTNEQIAKS